ncbi:hypothetical protein EC957_001099, partial [Mortierella hygrophila]
ISSTPRIPTRSTISMQTSSRSGKSRSQSQKTTRTLPSCSKISPATRRGLARPRVSQSCSLRSCLKRQSTSSSSALLESMSVQTNLVLEHRHQ